MSCTSGMPRRWLLTLPLLGLLAGAAGAAPPNARQVAEWSRQLGDSEFAVREQASRKLWEAREAAEPALETASHSEDAEVARRARIVLAKLRRGVYPGTSAAVVSQTAAYQSAAEVEKPALLQKMLEGGAEERLAAIKIAVTETDEKKAAPLRPLVFQNTAHLARQRVADGDFDKIEELVCFGACREAVSIPHYLAYWMLCGKLDRAIRHYEKLVADSPMKRRWEVLAYLYRAGGNLTAARRAAEKVDRPQLVGGILLEAGDWQTLAAQAPGPQWGNEQERLGHAAAFARLAGDRPRFEERLRQLRQQPQSRDGRPPARSSVLQTARILLLNDRPDEALQGLPRGDELGLTFAFEISCARLRFREALALLDEKNTEDQGADGRPRMQILRARTLYQLGEKELALAVLRKYGDQIKEDSEGPSPRWYTDLLQAEVRLGLKELAFEHAARMLQVDPRDRGPASLSPHYYVSYLFPEQESTASTLWLLLRELSPQEKTAAALPRLRRLMEGKEDGQELKRLIAHTEAKTKELSEEILAARYHALTEAALACRQEALALACLEKVDTVEAQLRQGDLWMQRRQWQQAAQHYHQAVQKDRNKPLPLLLESQALTRMGRYQDAERLRRQAHWLPLGDSVSRYQLVQQLTQRRLGEDSDWEIALLLAISEPESFQSGAAHRRLALAAAACQDYLEAARGHELSMLHCLHGGTTFVQAGAYVTVPALVHRYRALGLVAAGKIEPGLAEAALAQQLAPGNLNLPIALVPWLEQEGHKKGADQLYQQGLAVYEEVCRDYPRYGQAHNSAAWLSACCRRDLDRALAHARRAVELEPNNATYLDTLAEIQFQRGQQKEAIATQERAIALDPRKTYYRKQLERLKKGKPSSPRPEETED